MTLTLLDNRSPETQAATQVPEKSMDGQSPEDKYTEAILDRQARAAQSPEGRKLHRQIVRLATRLLKGFEREQQDLFVACAAAAAIQPEIAGTIFTAHDLLAAAMNADAEWAENHEPETLDLLLELQDLLRLMGLSPALRFYPHDECRVQA